MTNQTRKAGPAAYHGYKMVSPLRMELVTANHEPYVRKPLAPPRELGELKRSELAEIDAGAAKAWQLEGKSASAIAKLLNRPDKWVNNVLSGKRFKDVPPFK